MKELSQILELLQGLKLEASQGSLPCSCAPNQTPMPVFETLAADIEQHYTILLLWAIGQYCRAVTPTQVQQLVDAFLLNLTHTAPSGRSTCEPRGFEALQQQLQAFIDGSLDSYKVK